MEPVPLGEDSTPPDERLIQTAVALDGDRTDIAQARRLAGDFLSHVQSQHGLPVSQRAMESAQLVVSELVTNNASPPGSPFSTTPVVASPDASCGGALPAAAAP
jgi:hypothetical protein